MNCKQQNNFPSSWQQVKLGDICIISAGGTPSTNISHYWDNGNIPWANSAEINKREIYQTDNFITDEGFRNSSAKKVPVNSILIALAGQGSTRGKVAVNKIPITTNQSIAFCVPKEDIHYGFIRADLERRYKELRSVSAGNGGRGGLNLQIIKNINIKIPHFLEQARIVSILETWDKAIEKLSKKIQIKKQIKKGLMQNLLTGKKRLKGFNDRWEVKTLKELALISKGQQLNIEHMKGGDYPVINGGILESGFTNGKNVDKNTITISEGGNSCGFVNYITKDFWLGGHCYAVYQYENIDKLFLYFLLKLNELKIMSLRVGSGLPNIQLKSLNSFKISTPKYKEEQIAIAKILTAADKEIQLLEKKLQVIKNQKNYLLNNLITGTIRTPETLSIYQ